MMKKYVVALIAALATLTAVHPVSAEITPWQKGGVYAEATVITQIDWDEERESALVTVVNANGQIYQYYDDAEDMLVGDTMSCVFDINGTEDDVTDDIIIAAKYDRYDLLPVIEPEF